MNNTTHTTHTYKEIANEYRLWEEYIDPSGLDSEAKFNSMSEAEKIAFIEKCCGPEENGDDE